MSKIQASAHSAARAPITHNSKWSVASGFCASLVGIGLARFAYTPLLPAII